jgi:uncharacterized protein YbaR (Trm112 family)
MTPMSSDNAASATSIPAEIRALLACPRCRGVLRDALQSGNAMLVCEACAVAYPVAEGIPVLLAERATSWPAKV